MEYKKVLKSIKKEIIGKKKKALRDKSYTLIYNSFNLDSCLCTDRKNNLKELYSSEHKAQRVAKFLLDEQGIELIVYPCPYSSGWHLSRR
jgi:hypothetical protein